MRKIAISLITLSLMLHAAQAKTYSDKTFLMPRDQITNLAMEYTTWHKKIHKRADAQYNGTVQVVGFYQESSNKNDIGKYFGFDWNGKEGLGIVNEIGVSKTIADNNTAKANSKLLFNSLFILHDNEHKDHNANLNANYSFRPYQEVYGARFEWNQDLDKILDGLFFRVSTPLVNVRNHMNLDSLIPDLKQTLPNQANKVNFLDYLAGNVSNPDPSNMQAPLQYAKINGASHSSTGFADVELMLGYAFWQKTVSRAELNISMYIPTGKTPKGTNLFEPVHGNGHHWGVGVGLDYDLTMWERNNKSIEFMLVGKYKYLFEGTEKRTVNFKWPYPGPQELSAANYYLLGGKVDQSASPLFPLANVLTQDLTIRPGSVIDAIAAFAFNCGGCTFDIGYNLFFKEEERVNLKNHWENDTYAVADFEFDTSKKFELTFDDNDRNGAYGGSAAADGANVAIQSTNLDLESVTNPYQLTHKIYAGLGYSWCKMRHPILVGAGASYEIASKNTALEGWALWAKAGISW